MRDLLHFQISLPDLSFLWLFCSFLVNYIIFFLGNPDFSCFPQPLLFSSSLFFFPTVLFWGHQHSRRPVGLQLKKWCNPLAALQEGCQCTQKQHNPAAVPGDWQLLNGASLGWEGYGLPLEDPDKFLGLAWLKWLQCRQLKSIFGESKAPFLACEQFGGAHFF